MDCGEDEKRRTVFLLGAINDHKASGQYKTALAAQKYYDGENPTINEYEKILYDMQGKAHLDMYTANHKIASRFFGFVVDQLVNYLLGNGVTFSKGTDQNAWAGILTRKSAWRRSMPRWAGCPSGSLIWTTWKFLDLHS